MNPRGVADVGIARAALSFLAAISWHAIDRGAAVARASIICTGAVSIVAIFVTGRLACG
jgi:hypothetical protein